MAKIRKVYAYDTVDGAPMAHREIAMYIAVGSSVPRIASVIGVSQDVVRKVRDHIPMARHIEDLRAQKQDAIIEALDEFSQLLPTAIRELREILEDPNAKPHDKLKAIEMILDREKTGAFIKTMRQEKSVLHFVDGDSIQEIKEMAHSLGRAKELPKPEDKTVDAEFTVVSQPEGENE